MPSNDAIFVWIPKVAGTSITGVLEQNDGQILKRPRLLDKHENKGISCFGHMKVPALVTKGVIDRDYFDRSFKFSFVRNPWDRSVSLYLYFTRTSQRGMSVINSDMPFWQFCWRLLLANIPFLGFKIPPVGLRHVEHLSQCNPQFDWICDDDGGVFVDYIGRFENIASDFSVLKERLGLTGDLPVSNMARVQTDYRRYYSRTTRRIIEHVYRKDVKAFGYEF